MADAANLSTRKTEKLLTKSIKRVLSGNNINTSTRSGNRELSILVKKVASAPFDSVAAVEKLGSALGEKIAGLSQQNSKTDLDAGTIRSMSLTQGWMAEFDIPEPEAAQAKVEDVSMAEVVSESLDGAAGNSAEAAAEISTQTPDEPGEVALSESVGDVSASAKAEEIEDVAENLGGGVSTTTAVDPEAAAAANQVTTSEAATSEAATSQPTTEEEE